MPVVPMQEILSDAFHRRYGVAAFNVFNDLTLRAVLAAAAEARSPVVVQTSVKTVKHWGARLLQTLFQEMARPLPIPATLHLDHCADLNLIEECIQAGWNSVLFDGSLLSYEENLSQTTAVVARARERGVAVEGELEAVKGVEDGLGSDEEERVVPLSQAIEFIRATGIDSFAPAIGTAHGLYRHEPRIHFERVSQIVACQPIPLVVHGGTGLSKEVLRELIRCGAVKINISTQVKLTFLSGLRMELDRQPGTHEPLTLLGVAEREVQRMAADYLRQLGSDGKGA